MCQENFGVGVCNPLVYVMYTIPESIQKAINALCYLPFFQEMGGGKSVDFFVTSNLFISASSRATLTIKIFKIVFMFRKIYWGALYGRARKPRLRPANLEKINKITILWVTYGEA